MSTPPNLTTPDRRLPYAELPRPVRRWVETELGGRVVEARTQTGGFSTGVAARLLTDVGRRAFVKAVGTQPIPRTAELFRAERDAMPAIASLPCAPDLLGAYDDGDWIGLLLEDIDGRQPTQPWIDDDTESVFETLAETLDALTPSPWAEAPPITERGVLGDNRWSRLAVEATGELPSWVEAHLDDLTAMNERVLEAAKTDSGTLLHSDLRADNILITPARRVRFVDWAWARLGPAWFDVILTAADLPCSGSSVDVDRLLATHRYTRDMPEEDVTAVIAAIAGALELGTRYDTGVPGLAEFRRHSADALLAWTRRRAGW